MHTRIPISRSTRTWGLPLQGAALRLLLMPAVIALAAGLIAVGLVPAVAGAGQAISRLDHQFLQTRPGLLRLPTLPERSVIYAADGSVLATLFEDQDRMFVPLNSVPDLTRKAVLAVEDHKFYEHGPIDVTSIIRAAVANLKAGHIVQGGSTITQQLIKNTETGNAQTFTRKFQEAQDAIRLEKTYTKDQIFELYLNEIYLGHQVFGIGTAAEYYFGVPVEKLTLAQSAMLAGMISAPVAYDPIEHRSAAIAQREVALQDMLRYRWITQDDYDKAVQAPVRLSTRGRLANTAGREPFWVRYVVNQFLTDPRFGPTMPDRRRALFQGGLKIYTTIQPKLQLAARRSIHDWYPNPGVAPPKDPEAALVSVVPQTGAIVAMVGGTNFQRSQVDLASQAQRSTGSAFKAFTLTAAFEQGFSPQQQYDSATPVTIPEDKCPNQGTPWTPGNAEPGTGGMVDLRTATADSINTVFAQLIADVGPANVARAAQQMGLTGYIPAVCAITLGAVSVSPLAMTTAYSTLANNGVHCQAYAISKVLSRTSQVLYRARPSCTQVVPAAVAATVTSLLQGVISSGTGYAYGRLPDYPQRPEAGKTGTGENHDDAWFMGYIAQLCTGVWVGYSKNETTSLAALRGGFGGTVAAPVWHDFMAVADQRLPIQAFPTPPPAGDGTVPDVVGKLKPDALKTLGQAGFVAVTHDVPSSQPKGTVIAQSPPGGTKATLGSTVYLSVSSGHGPPPATRVPGVVGETEHHAIASLEAAGFRVSVIIKQVRQKDKDGIVIDQSPRGGSQAPPGSSVTIVVGQYVKGKATPGGIYQSLHVF